MPKRRQLSSRPDRSGDETRMVFGRIIGRYTPRQLRRLFVYVVRLICDAKLGQHDLAAAKAVGLDDVAADIQEALVHALDNVGPCVKQILRTVLKVRPTPIVYRQI